MRKYAIQETALWFIIKKICEDEDWVARITLYRNGKCRDLRKSTAKLYLFEDEALSWLMIAKRC